jgi:glycine C-acetyltransferase
MLYDAKLAQVMADELLKKGIYVIGFFFPVVPRDRARIRVQLSAAHTKEHLDKAIESFIEVGIMLNIHNNQ